LTDFLQFQQNPYVEGIVILQGISMEVEMSAFEYYPVIQMAIKMGEGLKQRVEVHRETDYGGNIQWTFSEHLVNI